MHNSFLGNNYQENLSHFCHLKKLPKVNKRPRGENSPNLANLFLGLASAFLFSI
jgi:hypothetical protein